MKQDFLNYIQETFAFSPSEMTEFSHSLSTPLKKTLRINTNKISIEDFKKRAKKQNWTLTETPLGNNVVYIDREDTSIALGNTLEHIAGNFYIQELAASSSPYYMSGDQVDESEYMILDMSASPGGKTTGLAEYYPNATIIANEIDRSRMRQLHENTDRMGTKNSYITNYDGRFFAHFPEIFDLILLDAPCSGEGTAYKSSDALKYWNIKNIKRIAKLQFQLISSALESLKVGGELVYSTCTLNRLENEDIIEKTLEKFGDSIEIIPLGEETYVRSWPHKNTAGGFFVAKIRKKSSLPQNTEKPGKQKKLQKNTQGFEKCSNTSEKLIKDFLETTFSLTLPGKFFSYRDEIYYSEEYSEYIWENFFLYKTGVKIGKLENGIFEPNFFLGTNFGIYKTQSFEVDESELDALYKGKEIDIQKNDGYYQIYHKDLPAGIVKIKGNTMKSLLETRFMRK